MAHPFRKRPVAMGLVLLSVILAFACVPEGRWRAEVDRSTALESRLVDRERRVADLEDGVRGLEERVASLEQELATVERTCAEDKARQQADCEARISGLETDLEELRRRLERAEREAREGREKIGELETVRAGQDRILRRQRAELESLEARSSALGAEPFVVLSRTEAPADPIEVELFYGTNRAMSDPDSPTSPDAGRFSGATRILVAALVLLLAGFFLVPLLLRKILKPQYVRWFVVGARIVSGALLVVLGFVTIRTLLLEDDSPFENRRIVEGERRYDVGTCTVTIPPTHRRANVEDLSIFEFRRDPSKHFTLAEVVPIDEPERFFEKLRGAAEDGDLFLFVHGYHNTFTDAAFRTAQIHHDLELEGAPVFFSWPSAAGNYLQSEANVDGAWRALAEFLADVLDRSGAENVRVLAHSMGSRVTAKALEKLAFGHPRLDELILAAPDIKLANYQDLALEVRPSVSHMTLYASSKDAALLASQVIHGGEPRAGQAPPALVVQNVDTIDVSEISSGHSYLSNSGLVLDHLGKLLTGRRGEIRLDETTARRERAADGNEYWVLLPPTTIRSGG